MRRSDSGTRVAAEPCREARSARRPVYRVAALVFATLPAMALWSNPVAAGREPVGAGREEYPAGDSGPAILWRHAGPSDAPVGPAVVAGRILFWATPRAVHAVEATDGRPAWPAAENGRPGGRGTVSWRRSAVVGVDLFAPPAIGGEQEGIAFAAGLAAGEGRVYARLGPPAAAHAHAREGRLLVAIDAGPAEGRVEWVVEPPAGYDRFASVPVPHREHILVAVARRRLALASLHASDGRTAWCVDLPLPDADTDRDGCWLEAAADHIVVATTGSIAVLHLDGRIASTRDRNRARDDHPDAMADVHGAGGGPVRLVGDRLVPTTAAASSLVAPEGLADGSIPPILIRSSGSVVEAFLPPSPGTEPPPPGTQP
jgi:hypothetical protein